MPPSSDTAILPRAGGVRPFPVAFPLPDFPLPDERPRLSLLLPGDGA